MHNFIKLVTIAFLGFTIASCDSFSTIVEVDLPDAENKMAVHIDLFSGSNDTSYFNVSKVLSENITDNKGKIDKSTLTVNIKNETDGTNLDIGVREFFEGAELYTIVNPTYQEGDIYTLSISHPDLESLSATAKVLPSPPIVNNITVEKIETFGGFEDEELTQLKFQINDPQGGNYYRMRIYLEEASIAFTAEGDTVSIETSAPYLYNRGYSNDPSIYGSDRGVLISDDSFEGTNKELIINIEKDFNTTYQFFGGLEASRENTGKGFFIFEHISEERYNFERSYDTFQNTDGNPFGTPTKVFNNIDNGYGIFSISTGQRYEIAY